MLEKEDFQRLGRLLDDLYLLTGVKFALMDTNGREVYTSSYKAPFCSLIMQAEGGYERCLRSDARAVALARGRGASTRYLCHAGLYEAALPVMDGERTAATIVFGQMLDDAPREQQWRRVAAQCAWHPDQEALYQAFLRLRRISPQQTAALMEVIQACVSGARLGGLRPAERRDDAYLLKTFIDTHYAEPLTAARLCEALSVGTTKLYALCRERFHATPMQLVTLRRVEAARDLLLGTAEPVRCIAAAVGVPDENYFAKVFRRHTGMTPTAYRRSGGEQDTGE